MTYSFARWEGATNCTGGPSSGAAALLAWCQANRQPPGRSLGIYNCRSVRGSSTTSLHGEGRALDWGLPLSPERVLRLVEHAAAHRHGGSETGNPGSGTLAGAER